MPQFDDASYIAITNFIRAHHVWLIFNADHAVSRPNASDESGNDIFNAAFLLDPGGLFTGVYHKQKLVIFGEYIPLVRWLPFVKWFTPITGSFEAGSEPAQFEMETPGTGPARSPTQHKRCRGGARRSSPRHDLSADLLRGYVPAARPRGRPR